MQGACNGFISRLKYNKQCLHIVFRDLNQPSKMRLGDFNAFKHQERLNCTNKCTRDDFRGSKTLIKVNPMYLEVKVKETKFHC